MMMSPFSKLSSKKRLVLCYNIIFLQKMQSYPATNFIFHEIFFKKQVDSGYSHKPYAQNGLFMQT